MPSASDPHFTRRSSSLAVLDPSPAESPTSTTPPPYSPTTTATLGLTTHRTSHLLTQLQRYSSYTFSAFLAAHVANTSLIPLALRTATSSATEATQQASQCLLLTRPYYQSALMEPALLAIPLITHVAAGLGLRLYRRHVLLKHYGGYTPLLPMINSRADMKLREWKRAPWPKVSWTSVAGYLAIPLVLSHSFITRGLPLAQEGGSSSIGLDYVSHGYAIAPRLSLLGYSVLLGVVGSHAVWGWAKWLGLAPAEEVQGEIREKVVVRKRRWWGAWGASLGVVVCWAAGGMGVVGRAGRAGGWVGRVYDGCYARLPGLR